MHIKLCDGCIVDYSAAMFLEKNNNDRDMSIKGFLLSHREMGFFFLFYFTTNCFGLGVCPQICFPLTFIKKYDMCRLVYPLLLYSE